MEAPVIGAIIGSGITVAGSIVFGVMAVSFKLGGISKKVDGVEDACKTLTTKQDEMGKQVGEVGERVSRIEGLLNGKRKRKPSR